jgi:hypothetical protein
MLHQFDTVLAFVAVLTGVSLVVTTMTQMVSGLLALRGRHLRMGLTGLLRNYASDVRPYAEALSRHLLDHPLLSDSMFSQEIWIPRKWYSAAAHYLWSGWKYATAVRPGELRAIILSLTEGLDDVKALVNQGLEAIGRVGSPPVAVRRTAGSGHAGAAAPRPRLLGEYGRETEQASRRPIPGCGARRRIEALPDFFQALAGHRFWPHA